TDAPRAPLASTSYAVTVPALIAHAVRLRDAVPPSPGSKYAGIPVPQPRLATSAIEISAADRIEELLAARLSCSSVGFDEPNMNHERVKPEIVDGSDEPRKASSRACPSRLRHLEAAHPRQRRRLRNHDC